MNSQNISPTKHAQLQRALLFLRVAELKEITQKLDLDSKGKKIELIKRILHFITTGEKSTKSHYPSISCDKPDKKLELTPETIMLKGQYKNDLKARLFFKKIIGEHFHFTAFGIDWLEEHWMQGNPPTYQEFANMWQAMYEQQKTNPLPAKAEWAYINFIKKFLAKYPDADRDTVMHAWHIERQKHVLWVHNFLKELSK